MEEKISFQIMIIYISYKILIVWPLDSNSIESSKYQQGVNYSLGLQLFNFSSSLKHIHFSFPPSANPQVP